MCLISSFFSSKPSARTEIHTRRREREEEEDRQTNQQVSINSPPPVCCPVARLRRMLCVVLTRCFEFSEVDGTGMIGVEEVECLLDLLQLLIRQTDTRALLG